MDNQNTTSAPGAGGLDIRNLSGPPREATSQQEIPPLLGAQNIDIIGTPVTGQPSFNIQADKQSELATSNSMSPITKPVNDIPNIDLPSSNQPLNIQPLLESENEVTNDINSAELLTESVPNVNQTQESKSQQASPPKAIVTKVKLIDEINLFDWFRTTDILNQIAEKAKSSVDSVITALDPGMKEYLYSGGNINIMVIVDSDRLVSPIRDAFQSAFGRATVAAARYNPPEVAVNHPIKLACGFDESITVAKERIVKLRQDTSNVPQNQVVVVVQPTLVKPFDDQPAGDHTINNLREGGDPATTWFLSYCMIIEDPILGVTLKSFSQLIPLDSDIVATARETILPDDPANNYLGFAISIDDLMNSKIKLVRGDRDDQNDDWLRIWSGLEQDRIIFELSMSIAHSYRRKWNESVSS